MFLIRSNCTLPVVGGKEEKVVVVEEESKEKVRGMEAHERG